MAAVGGVAIVQMALKMAPALVTSMAFSRSDSPKSPSRVALFRYQVVCAVLAHEQNGESRPDAVETVAQTAFTLDGETSRQIDRRTVYRWLRAFAELGLAGLEPASRKRTETSLVLPLPLLEFVRDQKRDDIAASLPELLRRAEIKGIISSARAMSRASLHRACLRMGITTARRKGAKVRDSRRFAYPHRMDMILSDGKRFRAGAGRVRRLAMFFLDNASRFGLHVVVGTTENKNLFLRGFYETLQRYGLPEILYLDHGPGFIAGDTIAAVAKLEILFIHGEVRYPEGHGMIEALHKTVIAAVLRNLDGQPSCDPDCGALELRLQHWLRETYNHTVHESLNGATPSERFLGDPTALRFAASLTALRQCFVVELRRRVSNDHIVSVDGVDYEVPRGLAGAWIAVFRQVLDETLQVADPNQSGRLVQIHPVDLAANARARRGRSDDPSADEAAKILPETAAGMAFSRDYAPLVGPDGGFADRSASPRPPKGKGKS